MRSTKSLNALKITGTKPQSKDLVCTLKTTLEWKTQRQESADLEQRAMKIDLHCVETRDGLEVGVA